MKNFLLMIALCLTGAVSQATTYYVATTGSDSNPGTISAPFNTWDKLSGIMAPGDIAYIRGGTYYTTKGGSAGAHIYWQNLNGTSSNWITIQNYPGEQPIFDCSNIGVPTYANPYVALIINCSYTKIKGLHLRNLAQIHDGEGISRGLQVRLSPFIILEQIEIDHIGGGAFSLNSSNDVTFLNCDAHNNDDRYSGGSAGAWGGADGYACSGGDNSTRTTFTGCRSWLNSDDGWDNFATDGIRTWNNCWSFQNGYYQDAGMGTPLPAGDGNGFKLGPADGNVSSADRNTTLRYLNNCLSFGNKLHGFDQNGTPTMKYQLYNCDAYSNGGNGFEFGYYTVAPGLTHTFKNNVSYGNGGSPLRYWGANTSNTNNTWTGGVTVNNSDFQSVDYSGAAGPRQADGSLPVLNFLKLATSSDLVNAGVNVGLAYISAAPDMGAFESTGASSNISPTANAGADQTITLPTSSVSLTGSGTDPDGSISAYLWTKTSGPTGGTITNTTSAATTVTGLVQGTYQLTLKVTDNAGASTTDIVQVIVNAAPVNTPPVANAGVDKTITLPTNSVSLTGTGTDPGGSIASYAWTKVSGPTGGTIATATAATTSITAMIQGVYKFELKVTDNLGAIGRDTVQVTVNAAGNVAPTANAGADKSITLPTNSVSLTGTGTDTDGSIASYAWTKVSGPTGGTIATATATTTSITAMIQGVYKFELKVTDNLGAIGRDTVQVTVNAAGNVAPTANAGADKSITLPTNSVSLTGTGTDPGGSIASYAWTKVSGPTGGTIATATAATTSITAMIQGVYKFELKVTDNLGAIGRDTVQVTVNAAGINTPPVANAGADKTITLPTTTVSLTGTGTDVGGSITAYAWSRISGPTAVTVASPTSATTSVSGLAQGVYKFEFRVTDNGGAIGRDTVQVTVNAASTPNNAYGGVRWAIPGTVQAENYDVGGQNSAYYDATTGNAGASFRTEDVDMTTCTEGGYLVGWSITGEWMKYSVNVTTAGTYSLEARIASTAAGKSFRVEMDGTTIATVTPPLTGGIQNWQTVTIPNINLTSGNKIMRIYWLTDWGVNINYLKFNLTAASGARIAEVPGETTVDAGTTVSAFPLPFSTSFTVSLYGETTGLYKLNLVDISGNSVWKKEVNKTGASLNETIYMGNLPAGTYFLQVLSPDQKKTTRTLIKN